MAGAVILLLASLGLLSAVLYRNAANRDFICYWSSAKLLRAHENPYSAAAVLRIENAAGAGYREPFIMRNPPWALFLVAPLGFFSAPVAAFLWLLTLIATALLAIKCLRMGTRPPPLVVYLFAPIIGCAMAGQTSIFLLAGIAFFFKYHHRLQIWSGLALLMPAMKPHLFLLLWPVILIECIRRKEWRVLAAFGGVLAAASAIPLFFDIHIWTHYLAAIRGEHIDQQYLANLSFLLRFMVPGHPVWVQALPSALGMGFLCRYYWRRRNVWDWRVDGAALLLISTMVSPYSWPFDQLLLIPAIIYVCSARASAKRSLAGGRERGGGADATDDDSAEFSRVCVEWDGMPDLVCVGAEEGRAGGSAADGVGDGVEFQPVAGSWELGKHPSAAKSQPHLTTFRARPRSCPDTKAAPFRIFP